MMVSLPSYVPLQELMVQFKDALEFGDDLIENFRSTLTIGSSLPEEDLKLSAIQNAVENGIQCFFQNPEERKSVEREAVYKCSGSNALSMHRQLQYFFQDESTQELFGNSREFTMIKQSWLDSMPTPSSGSSNPMMEDHYQAIVSRYLELAKFFASSSQFWGCDDVATHMAYFYLDLAKSSHLRYVEAVNRFGLSPDKVIGTGGYGKVYKAVLPDTGLEVAVK